jgi:hypothetical protein
MRKFDFAANRKQFSEQWFKPELADELGKGKARRRLFANKG